MRTASHYLLVLSAAALAMRLAFAQELALSAHFTVELTCGTTLSVSALSGAELAETALNLLESSEYNSLSPSWHFPTSELQEEYHRTLAGQHLRLIFDQPQTIESRSGTLHVREVIIRLGAEPQRTQFPDHFVDSVFSIADTREVVGYALYSGTKVVELWRAAGRATGSDNVCRLPADLPDVSPR